MNLRAYSSVTAFMAHYVALRTAHSDCIGAQRQKPPHPDDAATLIEMERIIGELSSADRDALRKEAAPVVRVIPSLSIDATPRPLVVAPPGPRRLRITKPGATHQRPQEAKADAIPSGAVARHRERAELKLRRVLAAHGLLTG
jgi:hypothetical protein